MATIEPYETKAGKRYRVRYRTLGSGQTSAASRQNGKPKPSPPPLKSRTAVLEQLADAMSGDYVAPSLGRASVGALPRWLARKRYATAHSHYRMLESGWRAHVQPHRAIAGVADIDQLSVEAWISGMVRGGAGATTVLRAHGCYQASWPTP